mmetsp:Transcript_126102/g.199976  ORF Transcript_126102/g.199976 Transcript_126102/m.199976 type:complete len:785 (-) Transcript_126102:127-2481(-)
MEKHLAFASETLIKWLAEAVSSDIEFEAHEDLDGPRSKGNLGELLRKAGNSTQQVHDAVPFGSPPRNDRQDKIDAPRGTIADTSSSFLGPQIRAPLQPSSESFMVPAHDALSPPRPRHQMLRFSRVSAVLNHVEASNRRCVLRCIFTAWWNVAEHMICVDGVSVRCLRIAESLTLQEILSEWLRASRGQRTETRLSAADCRANAAERYVQRRDAAFHGFAAGALFDHSTRVALLRLSIISWSRLAKESIARKRSISARKSIEELSFALAAAQADREGKATHLVKISIVGAIGITGPQIHCVCEVPDRPRSRFETGCSVNNSTLHRTSDQACGALDVAADILWNADRELFVADGEALQFTLQDREGEAKQSSNEVPQSVRNTSHVLGQATLRGFCLSGFDGKLDILNDEQKNMGSLLVKVAVGVIHFRQPSASLAKDEMTAFVAANAIGVAEFQQQQLAYGPQSKRGNASQHQLAVLENNAHAQACFSQLALREEELCSEWAVFYHSYSFAALIYELHAAVADVLFRFNSQQATLPRLLVHDFAETPDACSLVEKFNTQFAAHERDHHPDFRAVAISAMCSYVALGPEASPPVIFVMGYSQQDLEFRGVLEKSLSSCFVPQRKIAKLAQDIIELSEEHGLDVSQFGGKACGSGMAGHLLQIFVRRNLVDQLVFAAHPYGVIDEERQPISHWINSNAAMNFGQARLVAHPKFFMNPDCVRMHVVSADPHFHQRRSSYQRKLSALLEAVYDEPALRVAAARGIYGGTPPLAGTTSEEPASKSCCKMQ